MDTLVKICGLKTRPHLEAAVSAGADMVGFVFFDRSPRCVTIDAVQEIYDSVPTNVASVALTVDADDALLDDIVGSGTIDVLQLHGHETPERCADIRKRYGVSVMKVLHIETSADLVAIDAYAEATDLYLFDTKAPKGATRPGGNAIAFDWTLLTGATIPKPWLLAGGLTPGNVADAIQQSGAPGVDVSSGVESAPGEKDIDLIKAFIKAAKNIN